MQLFMKQATMALHNPGQKGLQTVRQTVQLATPKTVDLFVSQARYLTSKTKQIPINEEFATTYPAFTKTAMPKPQEWQSKKTIPPLRHHEAGQLKNLSEELATHYQLQLPGAHEQITELLGPYGMVTGRAKTADSILDKLRHWQSSPRPKNLPLLTDGIGTRLIFRHGHPGEVEAVLQQLIRAVQRGQLKIQSIHNYRGINVPAYLEPDQVQRLVKATQQAKQERHFVGVNNGPDAIKSSGYTTLQLKLIYGNGVHGELQVRGPLVNQVSEREHQLYAIRQGKSQHQDNPFRRGQLSAKRLEKTFHSLSGKEQADYLAYIHQHYENARKLERGPSIVQTTVFPKSLAQHPELQWPETLNPTPKEQRA